MNRENANIMIVLSLIAAIQTRTKLNVLIDTAHLYWHFLLPFFFKLTLISNLLSCYTCLFPLQLCRFLIFALSVKKGELKRVVLVLFFSSVICSYLWEEWKERHKDTLEEDLSSRFFNMCFLPLAVTPANILTIFTRAIIFPLERHISV